jgi:type II secretory pathway pseudopilin PulG
MSASFPNINAAPMRRLPNSAFTIVELLVAAAITALIVVLLGTMFSSLANTTSRSNQRTDAFRDARAALQMMERDLNGLVRTQWEPNPFTTPGPTVTPQPLTRPMAFLALKDLYVDPASGNQQLYALIAAKNTGSSDVCSVGYYCSWDGTAYSLRRFFRDSAATYATLSSPAPTVAVSPVPTPTPTPVYISETNLYKPNPSPSPTPTDEVLAQYVWNLKIRAYDRAGTLLPYPFVCDGSGVDPTSPSGNPAPALIEISFRAMSPEAARTVIATGAAATVWMDDTSSFYQRLIKPHTYEFRTRIKL